MSKKSKHNHCKKEEGCSCNATAAPKKTCLDTDCILVNSVVGSRSVQKVAETTLPITAFDGLTSLEDIVSISVVPNLDGITMNARVIRDKVVNIGLIPATITITLVGGVVLAPLTTSIPFQAHTDFPGACPQDILQETPLEVEGIFTQPGVPVLTGPVVGDLLEGILFKIILRTTITVTRPVLQDGSGNICDVNQNRCTTQTTPPSFTFPAPDNGGLLG
ncbi:hypothetical protein [Halobacillus sp. Marseille-Q1614]|uniref:hypothetical protein n=1 Tax=Halobacillus sp. Marseille-Q1614 TaxID=2709134 RepID=UPI00156F3154|nr:hypothetical protein [Halobacillus sp. Marseille-Q1614]